MQQQLAKAVKENINWFKQSGIMRPADGFWGVGERIVSNVNAAAKQKINVCFPYQTRLNEQTIVLEHRRADCNVEAAIMFDLAAQYFHNHEYRQIAENIIGFLINRSGLRQTCPQTGSLNLWDWAMPKIPDSRCWTDDNAWVIIGLLFLAQRGFGDKLIEYASATADAIADPMREFFVFITEYGRDKKWDKQPAYMEGVRLNPHWLGLVTMALAMTDKANGTLNYYELVKQYYATVLDGPPVWYQNMYGQIGNGSEWAVSEYAYLGLTGAVAAKIYRDRTIAEAAVYAGDILVNKQYPDGHFTSNHHETPEGEQLADLIYTQNWATLALQHLALCWPGKNTYRKSFEQSLSFLLKIQDKSDSPFFRGCWRGLYDCKASDWGGGDKHEGGQGSIYSGWTNAPITTAFLFELCKTSFL